MTEISDWTTAFPAWLAAARGARSHPPFDDAGRAQVVANKLGEAGKFSYLPPVIGIIAAVVLPYHWVWLIIGFGVFGFGIWRGRQRRAAADAELHLETAKFRAAHLAAGRVLDETLAKANQGEADAVRVLLERFSSRVGDSLRGLTLDASRLPDGSFAVGGRGLNRADVPAMTSRIGRGGRTFYDKRKAGEIDEDLTEWNAGAVVAALSAMFGGASPLRVAVRFTIEDGDRQRIPWVTLATELDGRRLLDAMTPAGRPSDAVRKIGGNAGRCRNQRYTAATEPSWGAQADAPIRLELRTRLARRVALEHANVPVTSDLQSLVPTVFPDRAAPTRSRPTGAMAARAAGVVFGDAARTASAAQPVPHAPAGFQPVITISITGGSFGGDFAAEAKKRAAIIGDPHAPFVPFQSYWSTYAQMNAAQLEFYFRWRSAVRHGQFIPTDLSYVFVHVYELIHVIGAPNAADAAEQLTRLWQAYRPTYPKLDNYLISWITDLYATEVSAEAALDFVQRHVDASTPQGDELLLATDPRWAAGDYGRMTPAGMAMLLSERRLGDNKFVREHNGEVAGQPWIEGAYRAAIQAADATYQAKSGKSPRDATLKKSGQRMIARPAFRSAVYSWNRKEVKLGKVPSLTDTSPSVKLYRSATRHAENLLRKERGFQGRLRGVELSSDVETAVEACIVAYIRATKPRVQVTIDVARAERLAQESVDTRTRLLQGLDAEHEEGSPSSPPTPRADGLLTDVDAVASLIARLTAPAEALIIALVDAGWELPEHADALIAATGGVLIGPLMDEINGHSLEVIGTGLIVREAQHLVIQEDYRDEVYFIMRGNLDGFTPAVASTGTAEHAGLAPVALQAFGPVELQTLVVIVGGAGDVAQALSSLAAAHTSTPLLLLDHLNECAVDSAYGDILVDADASPPAILPDAHEFVATLLAHIEHSAREPA